GLVAWHTITAPRSTPGFRHRHRDPEEGAVDEVPPHARCHAASRLRGAPTKRRLGSASPWAPYGGAGRGGLTGGGGRCGRRGLRRLRAGRPMRRARQGGAATGQTGRNGG